MPNMTKFIITIIFFISFNTYCQNNSKSYNCYNTNLFKVLPDNSLKLINQKNEETTITLNNKTILIQGKIEGDTYLEQFIITGAKQDEDGLIVYTTNLSGEKGDLFMFFKDNIMRETFLKEINQTVVQTYYFNK